MSLNFSSAQSCPARHQGLNSDGESGEVSCCDVADCAFLSSLGACWLCPADVSLVYASGGRIEVYNDSELQELRRAYRFVSRRRFEHVFDQPSSFLPLVFAGLGAGIPMGW
jgi:hypothetical protein